MEKEKKLHSGEQQLQKEFNVVLRKYLDDHFLTVKELADIAQVSHTRLWMALNKGARLRRITALKIQHATQGKVPISTFGYYSVQEALEHAGDPFEPFS